MTNKSRFKLHIVALIAAASCAACAKSPPADDVVTQEPVTTGNYFVGQNPVYAYLDTGSGGSWVFSTLTESDLEPASGYLVRLNDLAPAFDTRLAECVPQTYPVNHRCSLTHPFRNKEVGVIGKLISGGIAAGTAGKVTEISRNYETSFDEAAFNQAVDEALVNTGLDADRKQLLTTLENFSALAATARQELDELAGQANSSYRDIDAISITVQPSLQGLTGYFTNDIDFRSLIEIVPRSDGSLAPASLDAGSLLPCDARKCAVAARAALSSLENDVKNAKSTILSASSESLATYEIRCPATTQNGYLFTLTCPKQIQRDASSAVVIPLTVNIHSRDFEGLYPYFDLADERLRVSIGSATIDFRNLTENYLAVMAQTVYYNSQIQTNSTPINLAPGVTVSRPISDFVSPAIGIESSFRQMTPDKAAAASFRFGFATKYRVSGQAAEFTLYDQRTFSVGCTIDNRIKFGTCTQPAPEKTPDTTGLDEQEQRPDDLNGLDGELGPTGD